MMTDDEFRQLATRYLEDALDEDEVRRLNRELGGSPERVSEFNDLRLLAGLIREHGRTDAGAAGVVKFPGKPAAGAVPLTNSPCV